MLNRRPARVNKMPGFELFCVVLQPICSYNQYGLVWSGSIERICYDSEYSY